jgi:hypothetical protein
MSEAARVDIKDAINKRESLIKKSGTTINNMQNIINESARVNRVANNAKKALKNIDDEFESQTKLSKIDIGFLFFATALQCARQYLLTDFEARVDDQTAAKAVKNKKEKSNRDHAKYNPSLEEIISNPVPFDAMFGSPSFKLGLNGLNHRQKTLGHDPILGWIFGTSNIATSTITTWGLEGGFPPLASHHVGTGIAGNGKRDKIISVAKTSLVIYHAKLKLLDEGLEGKAKMGQSLIKEWIHLKSDIKSYKSLPLPIVYSVSPGKADKLASYGIDTGSILSVAKQATYAYAINVLIGMIHSLFYNEDRDGSLKLYSIRTNKLITYSNLLASASNIIYVTFASLFGDEGAIRKLDIGGFLVALMRLITDKILISEIKEEFVINNFNKLISG